MNSGKVNPKYTYLLVEIVRKTKATLFTHALEAATAPVHSILRQEEDHGQDEEAEEAEYHEHDQSDQRD